MKSSGFKISETRRRRKGLKIVGFILIGIFIIWAVIYFFPTGKIPKKAFFDYRLDRPLVIAHQGGEHLAPSNTLTAFQQAKELGVDVLEFDVHMTKDGYLVAIHDDTVDRTTDGSGRVNDLTLEEIKQLDAGYYFHDENGEHIYRGKGITIPTLEEIFEQFPDMRMNIELKKTNDPAIYEDMVRTFWDVVQKYEMEDRVLAASFSQEIIEMLIDVSDGKLAVSGGRDEVEKFVIYHKIFLNSLYRPKVDAIQIPTSEGKYNLMDKKLIRGAEKQGMEVHYWTINDQETMKELIELGADGIITDRPDLMIELLQSEGKMNE